MPPRTTRWIILFVSFLFVSSARAQRISPIEDRIDAIVDRPLVVPVRVDPSTDLSSPIPVRLDDGRVLASELALLRSAPSPERTAIPWSGDTRVWSVERASDYSSPNEAPRGAYILVAALPIDAVGQGVWIAGTRYEPNWLPAPQRVILETSRRDDGFWDAALSRAELGDPMIADAVARLRESPVDLWRAELVAEGFSPERDQRTEPRDTQRELDAVFAELKRGETSELADTIADAYRARWQIILGRLWLINPQVARDLKHTLTRTARVGTHHVPLWNDDRATLALLAHDLLSPFVDDELRVERVSGWLESQDQSVAWVIDDAGAEIAPGLLAPVIGVLDTRRTSEPITARVSAPGVETVIQRLEPGVVNELRVPVQAPSAYAYQSVDTFGSMRVLIGRDTHNAKTQRVIPVVSPPGVAIGPLLSDWTLRAISGPDPTLGALPPPETRVTGILTRDAPASEPDHRVGWRVHLDCVAPDPDAEIVVSVWIGQRGASDALFRVSSTLGLIESRTHAMVASDPEISSVWSGGVWSVSVPIPPELIDESGTLRLGVERSQRNHHSAWPRRMTPWDDEPGRIAFDLSGWIGVRD